MTGDDETTVTVCSIPEREDQLHEVIEDLFVQADHVLVWLNGYDHFPAWLADYGLSAYKADGKVGDAGKFAWGVRNGFHLTVDDDLYYPADYVQTMVEAVERYGRRYIVTAHGKVFAQPTHSFFHGATRKYHCLRAVEKDEAVHVPGTGVMAYHTSSIRFDLDDFPKPNMADLWAAVKAQRESVGIVCIAHEDGWIRQQPIDLHRTLYARHHRQDGFHTSIINENMPWRTYATT